MQHTLRQLESRVLLAGCDHEILTHIHAEVISPSGEEHGLQAQCSSLNVYDTYFISGVLERCMDADCQQFQGAVVATGLPKGMALVYQGLVSKQSFGLHAITIKNDGTATDCTFEDYSLYEKPCRTIQGRIDRP